LCMQLILMEHALILYMCFDISARTRSELIIF